MRCFSKPICASLFLQNNNELMTNTNQGQLHSLSTTDHNPNNCLRPHYRCCYGDGRNLSCKVSKELCNESIIKGIAIFTQPTWC
ncbi:hypothetical protein DdX_08618 [Ditylenchus destructor]|uniref:Uncharacterized protein n=1 Tax=Ditylenchus destructor TaxID=166010 RepID=A0AAD4N806_9BILA|nr:hypothetical protein DdX_08618 [Ditylenchus destructor]